MTQAEMWEAIQRSDASYDGLFFYAVKTTGIFCRPSCRSKPPRAENVLYFETAQQAMHAGFRPCKRCRSDLLSYKPMLDIAAEVKRKLEMATVDNRASLKNLGLTMRRLTDIFKQTYGVTPREYADALRLQTAQRLLVQTDDRIIDVAFQAGFSSLSAFNRFFKRQTGQTPSAYRKEYEKK